MLRLHPGLLPYCTKHTPWPLTAEGVEKRADDIRRRLEEADCLRHLYTSRWAHLRLRMLRVAKKWHIYRGYAGTPFITRDSSCFGRFWNCMDFPGDSTWCFFVPNHFKQLVSVFFGEMVSISIFPCFYPPVCKLLVFQIWMFLFSTSIYRRFGNGEVDSFWRDRVKTSDVKSTINRCFTNCSSCIMKCFPTPCCNL